MKKLTSLLLILAMSLTFTACATKEPQETTPQIDVARNDWYGAILRMDKLDKDAKAVVDVLDNNNYDIVMGNPQDYWSDGYYHFTFTPLESKFINYTLPFNESDAWETVSANAQEKILAKVPEATNFKFTRDDENEYSVGWEGYDHFDITNSREYIIRKMHLLYDASHNWAQLTESTYKYADDTRYEEDLVEYAEIDKNHYALQCQKGRLYTEYNDDGKLVKMYYSRLGTDPRVRQIEELSEDEVFVVENVFDMDTSIGVSEEPTAYETNPSVYNSEDDSIFSILDTLGYDWVMAEDTIDQYVVYENEVLMFRTKNKLSGEYEGFIISDVVNEPILGEDGKYYDPVSGVETSLEEYNERLNKISGQIESMNKIIESETDDVENAEDLQESEPLTSDMESEKTEETSNADNITETTNDSTNSVIDWPFS